MNGANNTNNIAQRAVYQNPEDEGGTGISWYKPDGSINYPPNNGAVPGTEVHMKLKPGDTIGRYGNIGQNSNFVTQTGADASKKGDI